MGVTEVWDPGFDDFMKNAFHHHPKNMDHNSGNPIGISVCQLSAHGGNRVTASGAYLASTPSNLTIRVNSSVSRLIFEGKKVVGVETNNGTSMPWSVSRICEDMLNQG